MEIIKREPALAAERFTLSQTMLRVKDIEKSLKFYRDCLGTCCVKGTLYGTRPVWLQPKNDRLGLLCRPKW